MTTGASALTTVRKTARELGTELPDSLTADLEAAPRLVERAEQLDRQPFLDAVLEALTHGRDIATDPAVAAALPAYAAASAGVVGLARERADRSILDTLASHCDALLAGWAAALQPAADDLRAAADRLHFGTLAEVPTESLHPDAFASYVAARDASRAWAAAVTGASVVLSVAGVTVPRKVQLLSADPVFGDRPADPWQLARAGAALTLPDSAGEARLRAEARTRYTAGQRETAAKAEQQAWRSSLMRIR